MKDTQHLSRRSLLKAGTATMAGLIIARSASAQEELSASDPTAVALGYVPDASTVDKAKWPKKADDQNCSNCILFAAGDGGLGKCSIFPGKLVNAEGWCSAWNGG